MLSLHRGHVAGAVSWAQPNKEAGHVFVPHYNFQFILLSKVNDTEEFFVHSLLRLQATYELTVLKV